MGRTWEDDPPPENWWPTATVADPQPWATCPICGSAVRAATWRTHQQFHDHLSNVEVTVSNLDAEANAGDPDY